MNRAFLAAAAAGFTGLCGFAPVANAAANNPLIVWQGAATITALKGADCANTGFAVGDLVDSIYRPNLDPAEPVSGLSLISRRSAIWFFRSSGNNFMNGKGNYSGGYLSGRVTQRPNSQNSAVTGAYNLKITPATFTATTTQNVDIVGTFTHFYGWTNCTVTISGSYQRRP